MSKEEKINKILEMTKELIGYLNAKDEDIDNLYVQTKLILETYRELNGVKEVKE